MTVAKLVAKPTADEEAKASVLAVLRETLAEAEAGGVKAVVLMVYGPDDKWYNHHSGILNVGQMIGHMEITKHEIIEDWQRRHASERFP